MVPLGRTRNGSSETSFVPLIFVSSPLAAQRLKRRSPERSFVFCDRENRVSKDEFHTYEVIQELSILDGSWKGRTFFTVVKP